MANVENIVQKQTPKFKEAQQKYLDLFFSAKAEEYLKRGEFAFGENAGKFLGCTTQKILDAKLPKPFGCPHLFIQPCFSDDKCTSVIWFCGINGCICICCREDFKGEKEKYPDYCPSPYDPQQDDCALHEGDCSSCPSRYDCHPDEFADDEPWEDDDWEFDY